jgi:hypothetical protein
MSRVYWIEYKGKQILFSDYANLSAEELLSAVKATDSTFSQYQHMPHGSVLALLDFANTVASKDVISALKTSATLWRPLYKKQALIGLAPLHYVFINAINKFSGNNFRPFKSRNEALAWLVMD